MPGRASRSLAILKRRDEPAELYLKGATQTQIAKRLNVVQATVHNDLNRVREAWRESSVRDFDELRTIELLKIERIEQEAWGGWDDPSSRGGRPRSRAKACWARRPARRTERESAIRIP